LGAEAERILAAKAAALAAEAEAAFAERESALVARTEAMLAAKMAELATEAEAALAAKETALAAREAALGAEAERVLAAKATLAAEAETALAAREAAVAAATERMVAEKVSALSAEAERILAAREAAMAAEAERVLAAKEAALGAEAERVLAAREAALGAEAERTLAKAAAVVAEAEAAFATREAALASREAALGAETERILAAKATLVADAEAALASREAALAADAERVLAAKEAALQAEAARVLAAQEAALRADSARVLAAQEAALAAEAARVLAAEEAETEAAMAAEEFAVQAAQAEVELAAASLAAAEAQSARWTEADAALATGAVVRPIARPPLKLQPSQLAAPAAAASTEASLVELLRAASGHRASTVYALVDARPMMRVEGQIALVGIQAAIVSGDVERFIYEFAPRDLVANAAPEWTCEVPGVGRVRCVTFHDQSGAGLIFHLPSAEVSTADETGLGLELQALCAEADGLIVVAGPRSSGKSALLSAFVDVINSTRYDHVITIESQIRRVHEKRLSFISQREVRGDGDAIATAARAALREGPDVLVIEDLRAPEALVAALDAARAGRLVLGSISAPAAPGAIERLIDAFPPDRRPQVRASLAGALRAVVAQILVPKVAGGRIAAREVLLSSAAVRKLVLDGAIAQLPIAIESGRSLGMKTMVDSLGALVREGVVDIQTACGCAPDRAALVSALERDGIDVSGLERRA
jgi:twitching motility protein PilT